MFSVQKKEDMKQVQVKIYFYFELSSKPNGDILGIAVTMWKKDFETIFTYNDVMNIQDSIEKGFGSRERAHSMGLNTNFFPIRTNRPHDTPNYGPGKYKFEIDYYR